MSTDNGYHSDEYESVFELSSSSDEATGRGDTSQVMLYAPSVGSYLSVSSLLGEDKTHPSKGGILHPAAIGGAVVSKEGGSKVFQADWRTTPTQCWAGDMDGNRVRDDLQGSASVSVAANVPARLPVGPATLLTPDAPLSAAESKVARAHLTFGELADSNFGLLHGGAEDGLVDGQWEIPVQGGTIFWMDKEGRDSKASNIQWQGRVQVENTEEGETEEDATDHENSELACYHGRSVEFQPRGTHQSATTRMFLTADRTMSPGGLLSPFNAAGAVSQRPSGAKQFRSEWPTTPIEGTWRTNDDHAYHEQGVRRASAKVTLVSYDLPTCVPLGASSFETQGVESAMASLTPDHRERLDLLSTDERQWELMDDAHLSGDEFQLKGPNKTWGLDMVGRLSQTGGQVGDGDSPKSKGGLDGVTMRLEVEPGQLYLPEHVKSILAPAP